MARLNQHELKQITARKFIRRRVCFRQERLLVFLFSHTLGLSKFPQTKPYPLCDLQQTIAEKNVFATSSEVYLSITDTVLVDFLRL